MILGKKDNNDTDLERCLASLEGQVDAVFINYNGGGKFPEINKDNAPPISYTESEWEDDFALARNQSFQFVKDYSRHTGEEYDWIFWIDSDDTLEGGSLKEMLLEVDSMTQGIFLRYDYAVDKETETVVAVQWRERLFRMDANAVWHYPIHEVCHTPAGAQYARKENVWIRHWRDPNGDTRKETRERNRRILMKAKAEYPDEPRFRYYFANEVYAEAAIALEEDGKPPSELISAAIKAYQDFIPDAPSPDDAYIAAHQCGELNRMDNNYIASIESDLEALAIHPSWPDAYVGIAQAYMNMKDWDKCEHWANACLLLSSKEETTQVREPLNNSYLPRLLISMAQEAKGKYKEAIESLEEIVSYDPNDEISGKIERLKAAQKDIEENGTFEDFVRSERQKRIGSKPERSICFFTLPIPEIWHPETPNLTGLGGAETCVIEISKRFAEAGWRVVVFGNPGEKQGIDANGVEWWNTNEFLSAEKFKVFVSSRSPDVFDSEINAEKKFLWMHDVNIGPKFNVGPFGDRRKNYDALLALTPWHANHLRRLYELGDKPIHLVPNGIDLRRYKENGGGVRKENRFIFSSSPDRGIEIVLDMWPRIRNIYPDAELRVFYGWDMIDKIIEFNPDHYLSLFKQRVAQTVVELGGQSGGIYWHNRVAQDQLANWQLSSDAWLYPTYFEETFCLTAVEMAAAGVLPVTSNVAGLASTVPDKYRVDGWPNNFSFQDQYINRLQELKNEVTERERGDLANFANNFTWDKAYEVWKKLCE